MPVSWLNAAWLIPDAGGYSVCLQIYGPDRFLQQEALERLVNTLTHSPDAPRMRLTESGFWEIPLRHRPLAAGAPPPPGEPIPPPVPEPVTPPPPLPSPPPTGPTYRLVSGNYPLRSLPSQQAPSRTLSAGAEITVVEKQANGWWQVTPGPGIVGWIAFDPTRWKAI